MESAGNYRFAEEGVGTGRWPLGEDCQKGGGGAEKDGAGGNHGAADPGVGLFGTAGERDGKRIPALPAFGGADLRCRQHYLGT